MARRLKTDGNKPDRYDLIHDHIVNGTELKDSRLVTLLERAKTVWPMLAEGQPTQVVRKKVQELYNISYVQAYEIINQTEIIFGRARKFEKEALKGILIEVGLEGIQMAKKKGDVKAIASLIKQISTLSGLNDNTVNVKDIYISLQLPKLIVSNDPKVLAQAEEVPFEEIGDE